MKTTLKTNNKIEDNRKEIWALSNYTESCSNPNILLNSCFKINQRGSSSYTSSTTGHVYTVDRWRFTKYSNIFCSFSDNTLRVWSTNASSDLAIFSQNVENYKDFAGKKLTFSLKYSNLEGKIGLQIEDGVNTFKTRAYSKANGRISLTADISSSCARIVVSILKLDATTISVNPNEAKLEVGSRATLFTPRTYAEELTLCQRFGFSTRNLQRSRAEYIFADSITFSIPTPTTLRRTPTIDTTALNICSIYNVNEIKTGFTHKVYLVGDGLFQIRSTKTAHGLTDALLNMAITFIDSEIY